MAINTSPNPYLCRAETLINVKSPNASKLRHDTENGKCNHTKPACFHACRFCMPQAGLEARWHKVIHDMETPDEIVKSCFETLLAATAANNIEQFVSVGDLSFIARARRDPDVFHRAHRWLAPRIQKGVAPTFMGEMRHHGLTVYLWRLRFDDGGNDLLFRMGISNGKVTGALVAPIFP